MIRHPLTWSARAAIPNAQRGTDVSAHAYAHGYVLPMIGLE